MEKDSIFDVGDAGDEQKEKPELTEKIELSEEIESIEELIPNERHD